MRASSPSKQDKALNTMRTILTNATLIDCVNPQPAEHAAVVIENGRIAEQGTHAELLRERGHYYRLYTQQFRHQLEVQYGVDEEGVVEEAVAAN
jgi:hypothetical protein